MEAARREINEGRHAIKKLSVGLAFLGIALLLPGCPHLVRAEDYIIQAVGPFGTLNNSDNPLTIPAEKAQDLLNVDITPSGKSVKKRRGYATAFSLTITTSPVHGTYLFYDSSGNDVVLAFNDRYVTASVSGATAQVLTSTATNGATWQCTDSQGFAYCANSNRSAGILKTNGTSFSYVTVPSTGTTVTVSPIRMYTGGFSDFPNRVDVSKANDFATWTTGSAGTDAYQFTITSPGSRITHLVYAFNRVMYFKDSSFGFILEGSAAAGADWQIRTVSPNVGTLDNSSVYFEDVLYFKGQDGHYYAYDGANLKLLSREIQASISQSQGRTINSWTQSSQSDFQAGRIQATGDLSTTLSAGSVIVSSYGVTHTTNADFLVGTSSNVNIQNNQITISTNNSGSVANNDFESGTTTDADNWDEDSGEWDRVGTQLTKCGSISPFSGSWMMVDYRSGATTKIVSDLILSSNSFIVANSTVSGTTACGSWQTETLTPSNSYIGLRVKIRFATYTGTSSPKFLTTTAPFILGGAATFKYRIQDHPTIAGDYYYLIDLVSGGSSTINSGSYTSPALDTGLATPYVMAQANWTINDSIPSFSLQNATSTNGAWGTITTSTNVTVASSKRYVRYTLDFVAGTNAAFTSVDDVSIVGRSTGTFYSQVKSAPNLRSWDSFSASKSDNGGTHTFYIRASTGTFTVLSTTPSWTAVGVGAVPAISTGSSFQIRDDFTITLATQAPQLDSFTQSWFEGSATDKAYATYFEDAIWWAVVSGTGTTTNNRIHKLDLINGGWVFYDLPANGFYVRNQSLYFGGVAAGTVFKFGDTDSDNGTAINAYWKSKDFFGDSPFTDKEIRNVSLSAGSVASSSMTVTYTLNGQSSTSYTMPLYTSGSSFTKYNKNVPLGRQGGTFNIQFGNNASDQPFEVFAIQFGYVPKPWKPSQ